MGGTFNFVKTIAATAITAIVLYGALNYAIIPLFRRYRQQYHHYLPLDTISSRTTSVRHRIADALTAFILPSTWNRLRGNSVDAADDGHGGSRGFGGDPGTGGLARMDSEELFDDEEGEGMVGFEIDNRRREALEQRRSDAGDTDRRLSRDLEQGFRDDSDEGEGGSGHARGSDQR